MVYVQNRGHKGDQYQRSDYHGSPMECGLQRISKINTMLFHILGQQDGKVICQLQQMTD